MTVETMARLAQLPRIIGVKDATNDLTRPVRTKLAIGAKFCLLSGEDRTAVAFLAQGGHGCMSVTANVAPKLCAVIEDSPSGVVAAVAAGMVAFGFAAREEASHLVAAGARVFHSMQELRTLLELGET